jgi:hypothetical protein
MRIGLWVVAAFVAVGIAYSLGPDMARYMKMRSM